MAFLGTRENNVRGCWVGGLLFGLAVAVVCAGCSCDSDGTEASIEIEKPGANAELTYEDDAEPDLPGFQYSVEASTENLEVETAIELYLDYEHFDPPVISYPDKEEMLRFVNVTLPEGKHQLKAGSPTGSVFSDPVEYTLYHLEIDSPADGATLTSDADGSTEGLQSDVVVNVYGFDAEQEIVLTVTDEEGNSETYEEQTGEAAEAEAVLVTFDSVTFPPGEVDLVATTKLEQDTTVTSATCTVNVPSSSCSAGYHLENGDCVLDEECLATTCSRHGSCDDSSGTVICSCNDGYSGTYCDACDDGFHASGTDCVEDEQCPRTNPCNGNGTCNDSTGEAICTCDDGYTGDTCNRCSAGFHLDDGECVLDQQCLPTSCSGHGDCSLNDNIEVVCDCDTGYTDTYCEDCASGYHESDDDCVEDEECPASNACSGHGDCDDDTGVPICTCDDGYEGDTCDECSAGFHLDDGECVLDQQCLPTSCNGHGDCSLNSNNQVECDCDSGYADTYCDECESDYHWLAGECVPDGTCDGVTCSGHGVCDLIDGEPECDCDSGYAGANCSECDEYFQDNDDNGECTVSCDFGLINCGSRGTCDDSSGTAVCACSSGWTGAQCNTCIDDAVEASGGDRDDTAVAISAPYNNTTQVACTSDEDWFAINLLEGDEVTVTVNYTYANGDIDLYLYREYQSAGTLVDSSETFTDTETVSNLVSTGNAGKYLIRVRLFSSGARNAYTISVTKTTSTCYTCGSLGVTCGEWDDGCGGTIDCTESLCTASDEYCEQHVADGKGTCAQHFDDLVYGCCEGDYLNNVNIAPGMALDCTQYEGLKCGWIPDNYFGGSGYFYCASPGSLTTPPSGVLADCPDDMTWE